MLPINLPLIFKLLHINLLKWLDVKVKILLVHLPMNSVANYVSGYLKNNAHLSNNKKSVPQFKYNQNTLNLAHNHNFNTHNINKNNKELRISSSKANKLIGNSKKSINIFTFMINLKI